MEGVAIAEAQRRITAAVSLALGIAVPAEGVRQVAYYDPPGILTVCYGSTFKVEKGKVYSMEECKKRLDADMLKAVEVTDRCVPDLPLNVLAAFADAVYNVGTDIVCNPAKSQAAKFLREKKYLEACSELPRWDKAHISGVLIPLPGLTRRRGMERLLCESSPA